MTLRYQELSDTMGRVFVEDTGQGIMPENMELVFQPFERLEQEYSAIQGTGIGLAIARRLAEGMGGALSATSIPGEGSCFYLDIPIGTKPENKTGPVSEEQGARKEAEPFGEKTILYVEDNPANIELVRQVLGSRGFKLEYASNGMEGIGLAQTCRPDLILLDIHLPDMGGIEIFKHLKQHEEFKDTPVFALTANAMASDREEAMEVGFNGYLTKPFEIKEFVETLQRALRERVKA